MIYKTSNMCNTETEIHIDDEGKNQALRKWRSSK